MTNPGGSIGQNVTQRLAALDPNMTPERIAAKIANAKLWWRRAGVGVLVALLFCAAGVAIIATGGTAVPVLIALGVPVGLCALAVLYCVNQADSEATQQFIGELKDLRHLLPFGGKDG